VLCETLSEAAARGIIPVFFVKGGVAIELRLGLLARATRDLDIGLCAPPMELLPHFDAAIEFGLGDFRLRRRGEARASANGTLVLEVSLEYIGRPWGTVPVDLAPAKSQGTRCARHTSYAAARRVRSHRGSRGLQAHF
jgi:hypothetical protein